MTLERQNDAAAATTWAALRAPVWRAFSFDTGHFVLHVPTSHVIEVPELLARQVRGEIQDADAQTALNELARDLPPAPAREIKTDIRAASLNMAQGCNLRCTYCFAGEGDYGSKMMMSLETATRALTMLSEGKETFHVIFFGGEPLLNFSVIQQVVEWCEARPQTKWTFAVTTNGTLLSAERVAWMKEKRFSMNLSYDGKGLQARQRLNKDKVTNSEALVERKLAAFGEQLATLRDFRLRSTITKQNLDLLEEAIVSTINSTSYKMFVTPQATAVKRIAFEEADIDRLAAIFQRVIDRFLEEGAYEKLLRLENLKKHVFRIHRGDTNSMACGAGVNYLTVSAEGGYYLCHRFNEDESERFGGIDEGIRQDQLEQVRKFRGAGRDPCNSCWMRQWCAGGCMHENKSGQGHRFAIDPLFCKLQSLEMEQAVRVYSILLEKAPHLLGS